MNIQEATRIAVREGKFITREDWPRSIKVRVQPTDTIAGCILSLSDNSAVPGGGWQPRASDLLADDWEVIDGGYGSHKTAKIKGITIEL